MAQFPLTFPETFGDAGPEQISATSVSASGTMNTTSTQDIGGVEQVSATPVSASGAMNATTSKLISPSTPITASGLMNDASVTSVDVGATQISASASMNAGLIAGSATQVSASATMNSTTNNFFANRYWYVATNQGFAKYYANTRDKRVTVDFSGNQDGIGDIVAKNGNDAIYIREGTNATDNTLPVAKYDREGNQQWVTYPSDTAQGTAFGAITVDNGSNSVYVFQQPGSSANNAQVLKLDRNDGSVIDTTVIASGVTTDNYRVFPKYFEIQGGDFVFHNFPNVDSHSIERWDVDGNNVFTKTIDNSREFDARNGELIYRDISGVNDEVVKLDADDGTELWRDSATSGVGGANSRAIISPTLTSTGYVAFGVTDTTNNDFAIELKDGTDGSDVWVNSSITISPSTIGIDEGDGDIIGAFNNADTMKRFDIGTGTEQTSPDDYDSGNTLNFREVFGALESGEPIFATPITASASMNTATAQRIDTATATPATASGLMNAISITKDSVISTPATASASMNATSITRDSVISSPITASASMNATSITGDSVISTPITASATMQTGATLDGLFASPPTASASMNAISITRDSVISSPITASGLMNTTSPKTIDDLADAIPITASATMNAGSVTRAGATATAVGGSATMNAGAISQYDTGATQFTASTLVNDGTLSSFDQPATQIGATATVNDGTISNLTLASAQVSGVGTMNDGSVSSLTLTATPPVASAIMRVGAIVEGVNVTIDGVTVDDVTIDGETVFSLTIDGETSER